MTSNKKPVMNRNWWTPIDGVPPKKCPICSRMFYVNDNDKRKYCSDLCSYTSKIRLNMKYERRKIGVQGYIARRCPKCKLLFVTNNFTKKFCSTECQKRQRQRPFITRECPCCKLLFLTTNPRKVSCSMRCSQRFYYLKHPPQSIKKLEVCKHIYDSKDDPDSISDLIEDWTGIRCEIKDQEDG